jgi:hypothetical protein
MGKKFKQPKNALKPWWILPVATLSGLAVLLTSPSSLYGASPYTFSYGGRLTLPSGEALKGPVDLEIKFYRAASGGTPLPVSPVIKTKVNLVDGVFQVDLSELTAAEYSLVFSPTFETWVEVQDVTNRTGYPRQRLTAVPYAFKVPVDQTTVNFDGEGRLTVGTIEITKVNGLEAALAQKANTSNSVTIDHVSGLRDALNNKLSSTATVGGDVSGSLSNISVTKLNGQPVPTANTANTFLKYSGTALVWSTLPPAGGNGDMLKSENLSGLSDPATARTNLGLTSFATKTSITSTDITDGTLTDIDINSSAAIAQSKISGLVTDLGTKQPVIDASSVIQTGTLKTANQIALQVKPYSTGAGQTGELHFDELAANGTNYLGFKAPDALAANKIWTLPSADGTNGQILKTDGAGNLDWVSVGGTGTVISVGLTAPAAGITVSGGPITGSGSITLALGDDLAAVEALSTTGGVERTGANTWGTYTLTAAGKALIDDADATAQRTTLGLGSLATLSTVGSTEITNDSITNADINTSAAIATSKLAGPVTSIDGHGLGSLATLSVVGSTEITNDSIVDADINASAAIADTKLATISTAGKVSGSSILTGTIAGTTAISTLGQISTSGNIIVNSTGSATTELRFNDNDGSHFVALKSPATVPSNVSFVLPAADGTSGQFLATNGSGSLSWNSLPPPPTGTGGGAAPNPSSGCPTGYILVPGDTDFGTTDFCVMKYEAKFGGKGAISQVTGVPARGGISQDTARSSCRNLGPGYALINNVEWMTVAANAANVASNWSGGSVGSGALNRGHSDNSPADALAAVTDDNDPCNGTGQTCSSSTWNQQRRTHVLSNSNVIWDLSGNVSEWVDYYNRDNKPTPATAAWYEFTAISGSTVMPRSMLVPTNAVKAWWNDSWNGATNGLGLMYSGTQNSGGAMIRGGFWYDGTSSGLFAVNLNSEPSMAYSNFGFRCVFRLSSP